MRTARAIPMIFGLCLMAACSDSSGPVKPAALQIAAGNAQTGPAGEALPVDLSVKVVNSNNIPLRGVPITWSVVSGGGSISAQGPTSIAGIATAKFTLGNTVGVNSAQASVTGAAAVTFTATGVAGVAGVIRISRDSIVTRVIGDTTRLSAVVSDAHGNALTNPTVQWSSTNTTVAEVSSVGLVTVKGRGVASIVARSGTAQNSIPVRVIAVARIVASPDSIRFRAINQTAQLQASAFDAQNVAMPGVTYTYTALTPTVATVSNAGIVTAAANGVGYVVVNGEGMVDTVLVRVTQVVKSISVNPAIANVPFGLTAQLSGFALDSLGTAVSGVAFTFSSADTTIAKVSATGLVTGIGRGTTNITATSGGLTATALVNVIVLLSSVTTGAYHTCAIGTASATATDIAFCWGQQTIDGRLGNNSVSQRNTPGEVSGTNTFTQISAGDFHTCALTADGTSFCWGANTYGALGNGNTTISLTPTQTNGLPFTSISSGKLHTCALGAGDSLVYCWGNNTSGQLGIGAVSPSTCAANDCAMVPAPVVSALNFTKVSAGADHTCAIETPTGNAYCWGNNQYGQLGTGNTTSANVPALVSTAATFIDISAGADFTCGVTTDARVMCWGRNDYYQLGIGVSDTALEPVQIGAGTGFVEVSAGGLHACARNSSGGIMCWGSNAYGQLGNNSLATGVIPVLAQASVQFTSVNAGFDHSCASTASSGSYCWGRNSFGQLGVGDYTSRSVPTAVR